MKRRAIKQTVGVFALLALFAIGLYAWGNSHGSSFRATMLRGFAKAQVVFAVTPKATVLLPMSFDKQDHSLSCEVAGLKMALAYRGVKVDESELIEKVGFDPAPRKEIDGQLQWGNPQRAFVGNIDGKMLVNGYGVYWRPIARVSNQYRPTYVFEGWKIADLVHELNNQNPVVVWGYLGSGKPISWKTPDEKTIHAVYYEHIFVVRGYSGPAENPTGFHVIDTLYGNVFYSTDDFLKRWNALGRSGVVVS